jgi:hypothetical protein
VSEDGPRYMAAVPRCPDCGQQEAVPIVYGLPSAETVRGAEQGSFVLGGCVISGKNPSYQCRVCGRRFGVR